MLLLSLSLGIAGMACVTWAEDDEEETEETEELFRADYKVYFDANGGTWKDEDAEKQYTSGVDLMEEDGLYFPLADAVELPGYELAGWMKEKNGTTVVEEPYKITEEITLYAKWVKLPVVKFNLNGGSWAGTAAEQKYANGTMEDDDTGFFPIPSAKEISRKNHVFEGWTETKNGTDFVDDEYMGHVDDDGTVVDTTLYAKWIKLCKVTLNENGGKWDSKAQYKDGATVHENDWIVLPDENSISRKGYVFLGWTAKKNTGAILKGDYAINSDITLYARWAKIVSVTFDAGKGYFGNNKKATQKEVKAAAGFALGDALAGEDYVPQNGKKAFVGWYKDKKCTNPVKMSDVVTKDVTYYAKWETEVYKITVANLKGADYVNRATGQLVKSSKDSSYSFYISEGDEIGDLSASKKGVEAKLYFDKDCKQKPFYSNFVPTADTTVYAKFLKTIKVTMDANGGETYTASGKPVTKATYTVSKSMTCAELPVVVRKGYYFVGWYDVKNPSKILSDTYAFTKNITVQAEWEKGIEVKLDLKGGAFTEYNAYRELFPAFYIKPKTAINSVRGPIPVPIKSGYAFAGWKSSVTKKTLASIDSEKPAKNTTYTAVWNKKYVKVTLTAGAGSIYDAIKGVYASKAVVNVAKGKTLSQVELNYNGKDQSGQPAFIGWSLKKNGNVLAPTYKFTKAVTLYPIFAKEKDVRVAMVLNGGKLNQKLYTEPFVQYVQKGGTISLPDASKVTKAGYKLAGWYTDYKCTKKIKTPKKFKPTKNCYIYAKWKKK